MLLKINGNEIAAYPSEYTVTILDLDDADTTGRTADGMLHRDRVAVKRQVEMTFAALPQSQISALLQSMSATFFDFTFLDPMDGEKTITVYVGNRPAPMAIEKNGVTWWAGLKLTLTER